MKVIVLLIILITISSCTKMNFVCNDIFDSTLTVKEKADIIKKCSDGQFIWNKEF